MLVEKDLAVSVWLGNLTAKELESYITNETPNSDEPLNPFAADMGVFDYDTGRLGGSHTPKKTQELRTLISKLPYAASFLDEVLLAAKRRRIASANCAIALFGYELKKARWPRRSPLRFIGVFSYQRGERSIARR